MSCHGLLDFVAAVRSSGVDEDDATASFAEQHPRSVSLSRRVPPPELRYAVVVKKREKGRVVEVTTRIVYGTT